MAQITHFIKTGCLETKVVLYILPKECEDCCHSNIDPVIVSRATAMLIVARYERSHCPNCTQDSTQEGDGNNIKDDEQGTIGICFNQHSHINYIF